MRCIHLLAIMTCAVLAPYGFAAEQPSQVPEIIVKPEAQGTLTAPSSHEAKEALQRVPGGTNLIEADEFLKHRAANLTDVLENTPGVTIQPRFGAQESRLSIRGSGLQRTFHLRGIKLLQDGIPISFADGSGDFQSIDPMVLQYVEVYRGANALQFGSSTLGGAINLVTQTGQTAYPFQIRAEAGSFDFLRGQVSAGHVDENTDHYLSLSHFSQDGFRDHAHQDNQALFGNVGFKLSDEAESRFYWMISDSRSALPGNLTKAQMEADPTQANAGNVAGDHHRDQRFCATRQSNRMG